MDARTASADPESRRTVLLAHGASGSAASMAPWIDGLRALGLDGRAITLPRGRAEPAVPRFAAQTPDVPGVVIGGHSFGGRVATLLAAGWARAVDGAGADERPGDGSAAAQRAPLPARRHPVAGIVALSYPLHAPGRFDAWDARTAHWPSIAAPVLLLSGDADPFARPDLLREAVRRLPDAELVLYPGLGHGLAAVRGDALERILAFVRSLAR